MTILRRYIARCECIERCSDDGDIDGPGTCKGLPPIPQPPLLKIVLVHRNVVTGTGPYHTDRPRLVGVSHRTRLPTPLDNA